MQNCPCDSKKTYRECCAVFVEGKEIAPTPEILMRSRYTAYAQGNVAYIQATMKDTALKDFDPEAAQLWLQHTKWLGLEVLYTSAELSEPDVAYVEFIAHYIFNHKKESIHEMSEFHRDSDHWYYVDGKHVDQLTNAQSSIKIGRNDACPCNSGKKYKKCCG